MRWKGRRGYCVAREVVEVSSASATHSMDEEGVVGLSKGRPDAVAFADAWASLI